MSTTKSIDATKRFDENRILGNVWWLGVCYFALQIFQALDKFNRQNNRHQTAVIG